MYMTVCAHRNNPCDGLIRVLFGQKHDLDRLGSAALKRQLYLCMLGQALLAKLMIEQRRALNMMGLLLWQFNEIWPTGGFGSVEYGCQSCDGQVQGGRWKPLQVDKPWLVYSHGPVV